MKDRIRDVAVVGAGIAGSSLAKALADRGWDTVLIDRQRFPRHKVCGEFLSPESRQMLNAFGLRSHVEALDPSLINRTRLIFNQGDAIDIPLPGTALGVSRHSLDPALHHAALGAGVQVQTAAAVKSVYPHDRDIRWRRYRRREVSPTRLARLSLHGVPIGRRDFRVTARPVQPSIHILA